MLNWTTTTGGGGGGHGGGGHSVYAGCPEAIQCASITSLTVINRARNRLKEHIHVHLDATSSTSK